MLSFTSKTTTLLAYLTLLFAVAEIAHGYELPHQQRDHVQLKRFIRKRVPQFDDIPIGVAPEPTDEVPGGGLESSSSVVPSQSSASSVPVSSSSQVSSASASAESSASSVSSEPPASSSSSQPPVRSSSSLPAPVSSTTPPPVAQERSTSTRAAQTKIITASDDVKETSTPSMSGAAKEDQNKSSIVTILIAVFASLGGVAILWTVFRKWKLGSSKRFDKRLKPINWEKPGADDDDIVPANRRLSGSSHRSGNGSARSNTRLDHGFDHDFTAGPTHLSPVGGYADMSRGSSPSPQFGIPNHSSGYTGVRY